MNIESKLWKIVSIIGQGVRITQKTSGVTRFVNRSELPSDYDLAMMSEKQFDRVCREAFH